MDLHLDLVDRKDLSGEIYRQLKQAIGDGRIRAGEALPPTRRLAGSLGVSRTTVSVAYERLAGDGLIASRPGSGTFVSDHAGWRTTAVRKSSTGALRPQGIWRTIRLPTTFDRPARFDFRTGLPSQRLFPHDVWRRLIRKSLDIPAAGVYLEPAGHRRLRDALAWHLGGTRGVLTTAGDITITSGAQQALDIVARTLFVPGDRIAVEDPGYGLPRRLFESMGLKVDPVPVDRDGLVVDAIPRDARAVYVTPSHQYPLGMTMSLARRRSLLAWAERTDAVVIEDDYDGEFRFGGRPISALQALDPGGRVLYIGSFSKVMLPTLRLGFVVTPPSISREVQAAKYVSDWHTPLLTQDALAAFIEEGEFARHIRRVSKVYMRRHERIAEILDRDFRGLLDVLPSNAGLHLAALATSGSSPPSEDLVSRARERDVAFHPLSMFSHHAPAGVAIGYGAIELDDIPEGLKRLRACFG